MVNTTKYLMVINRFYLNLSGKKGEGNLRPISVRVFFIYDTADLVCLYSSYWIWNSSIRKDGH